MKMSSPSSIKTYKQCKRKYYYQYKLRIPEKKNVAMIGGIVVHEAIRRRVTSKQSDIEQIFNWLWLDAEKELLELGLTGDEIKKYYSQYKSMAINWEKEFNENKDAKIECEVELCSKRYNVRGIIDEISERDGKVRIMENKTCLEEEVKEEHKRQIGIYTLLYEENFKKLPDSIGVRFLRTGKKVYIPIKENLLARARYECRTAMLNSISDDIKDYPKTVSGLCWWRNGRCGYFELCNP